MNESDRVGVAILERSGLLNREHSAAGLSFVVDTDTVEVLASADDEPT